MKPLKRLALLTLIVCLAGVPLHAAVTVISSQGRVGIGGTGVTSFEMYAPGPGWDNLGPTPLDVAHELLEWGPPLPWEGGDEPHRYYVTAEAHAGAFFVDIKADGNTWPETPAWAKAEVTTLFQPEGNVLLLWYEGMYSGYIGTTGFHITDETAGTLFYSIEDEHWPWPDAGDYLLFPCDPDHLYSLSIHASGDAAGDRQWGQIDVFLDSWFEPVPAQIPAPGAAALVVLGTGLVTRLRRRGIV